MDRPKIALITGAGRGIGRATALALAGEGWKLVLTGRNRQPLEAVASEIGPDNALVFPADISDPEAVAALFAAISAQFGRLDLLFNNAGLFSTSTPIEDISAADWRKIVDVNLNGAFFCAQAAFRLMKNQSPQGGRIINNGSISAHAPRPNSTPYTATKHAMTGLTKSLALDGRAYNIACGQIDIGNAATDMTASMQKGIRQANGQMAVEPVMDVAHVGQAICDMARLPLDTNVLFMTIMASAMPFVGRG